jgi:hypothetical protein
LVILLLLSRRLLILVVVLLPLPLLWVCHWRNRTMPAGYSVDALSRTSARERAETRQPYCRCGYIRPS